MKFANVFLVLLLIVSSCKKNDNDNEPVPHVNTFSALLDGTAYVSNKIRVDISGSSVPDARTVSISATDVGGREMSVHMPDYDGTAKTYHENEGGGCYSSPTAYLGLTCSDGMISEIKLISIDKNKYKTGEVVTGTFYFDTDSTNEYYHITNGKFSVFVPQ